MAASIDSSHFSKGLLLDFLIVGKPYWFVVSYILLYIVSPVLNKFVEYEAPQIIKLTLLCFFSFEFVYGWLFGQGGFGGGYSTMRATGLISFSAAFMNDEKLSVTEINHATAIIMRGQRVADII